MIRPTKYTQLRLSVLNIASVIFKEINTLKTISYDELLQKAESALGDDVRHGFVYALDFLYALGRIDYDAEADAFFIAGSKEGVRA